ncbi:MAG: hypothetical protein HUJ22_08760 [Gracilimonas sp.]|uniref:hypothetical protein n=1 Tax=Gracilimonas sp. TaxID=1974203 RepID=UPI0019CE6864|nr:hypothetical protein [Gracilimonas sp.]MBD3616651.1 hypothetical protein [Gracilimonas sp.]
MDKIKLNPEIKKKADELFELIEKEVNEKHEDDVAKAMAQEWGDYLKTSKGFDILKYGEELTITESERAIYGLEDSFYRMDDETAALLSDVALQGLRVTEYWNKIRKNEKDPDDIHRMESWIYMLKETAQEIDKGISTLWKFRAKGYRREVEELKKAV